MNVGTSSVCMGHLFSMAMLVTTRGYHKPNRYWTSCSRVGFPGLATVRKMVPRCHAKLHGLRTRKLLKPLYPLDPWGWYIYFFFLPKPIAWTLPQVVGTNPLPTYYQEPRASLTAWWCIIEMKSFHVAKTSYWAKVSHWVKVSHWAKVSHWVKVSHWAQLSRWMLILGFLCWMGVGIAALVQLSSHVSIGCSCRMVFAVV